MEYGIDCLRYTSRWSLLAVVHGQNHYRKRRDPGAEDSQRARYDQHAHNAESMQMVEGSLVDQEGRTTSVH